MNKLLGLFTRILIDSYFGHIFGRFAPVCDVFKPVIDDRNYSQFG